jgi:hypothetical protein
MKHNEITKLPCSTKHSLIQKKHAHRGKDALSPNISYVMEKEFVNPAL